MTKLSNVSIPEKYILDPELAKIVYKLALDKPSWTFSIKPQDASHHKATSPVIGNREDYLTDNDNDIRFLRLINVYDTETAAAMGGVGVEYHYSRSSDMRHRFFVQSWRIETRRGTANRKNSVKAETIVREAKRTFRSKGLKELMKDGKEKLYNGWWHAIAGCTRVVDAGRTVKSLPDLQLYAFCVANERDVDMTKFQPLLDQLRSPQFEEAVGKYELAGTMQKLQDTGKLNDVVMNGDEYLIQQSNSEDAEILALSYEEMPVEWQERVAVLQLLQDNELVRDIGYRLDGTTYRIIA
jgi:hypothetical protein